MNALAVRASSWGSLFDCAYRWEGTHLLGMNKPSGLRALLGSALHASTAAFDQARLINRPISIDEAAGTLVSTLKEPKFEVDKSADDLTEKDAESVGLKLNAIYCGEVSPLYTFRGVEMETKPFDVDCGAGIMVRLTGRMDRARIRIATNGGAGITDLKTGATAVQKGVAKTKGHAAQIGTYELLYEHTTGEQIREPGEVIGMKTKGTPEVKNGLITNGKRLMIGTERERGLIEFAAEMFKTGLFPPNPQSMLCGKKYCARWDHCIYHD